MATRPRVPIRGMEEVCGCDVVWIERDETRPIADVVGEMPRCIFLGGWNLKPFARFRDQVRLNGGTAIVMCDSHWPLSPFIPLSFHWWRTFAVECAKALRFRLLYRHKYDTFFVPGKSGVRLLRFYGVPRCKIFTGLYAADDSLFFNGAPLAKRGKRSSTRASSLDARMSFAWPGHSSRRMRTGTGLLTCMGADRLRMSLSR